MKYKILPRLKLRSLFFLLGKLQNLITVLPLVFWLLEMKGRPFDQPILNGVDSKISSPTFLKPPKISLCLQTFVTQVASVILSTPQGVCINIFQKKIDPEAWKKTLLASQQTGKSFIALRLMGFHFLGC